MQTRNRMNNSKKKYIDQVIPKMKEKFKYTNTLAIPKIKKVVVNVGIGNFAKDEKVRNEIAKDLAIITGQKPVPTKSKKAIAGFKIRENMIIGLKTTLRGERMYDFISRLVNIVLPRTRDFSGISPKSVDQGNNLTIGIKEHIIFPEISQENVRKNFGLEITIVTNSKTREEALELFKLLGFPLKKNG